MAVFAASVRIGIAEADVRRSVQAECDRKERHGSNSRVPDFPQCTQYAHCGKVYHNLLPAVKYGTRCVVWISKTDKGILYLPLYMTGLINRF